MIEASCHCGAVRLRVASAPTDLNECQCSVCRRYAVRWAYYAPDDVEISVPASGTATYMWGERSIEFHRCPDCGCVSHWSAVDAACKRMGVNARLMPHDVQGAATVRQSEGPSGEPDDPTSAAISCVEFIPENGGGGGVRLRKGGPS